MSPKKSVKREEPILSFASAALFARWLATNHAEHTPVWLRIGKKSRDRSIGYAEAIEVALGWGWIDGQKRALDDSAWLQRFSRRSAKSPWSKINRAKAEALLASGKMKPPGLAEIERAKKDGRWARAYDGARTIQVPDDLVAAFAKNARARTFFAALDAANRYAILYRVHQAKKPETRKQRIARFVDLCARGEVLHPKRAR